ncbi:MAG: ABC transporter ATP-binding protein/permease [Ruminococcus sp.]|nr:ABC transporter ATP-binding protein/permease [Ruminococcus sp.]
MNKENKTAAVIKYFFPDAWRKTKGYFILSVINLLIAAAIPFVDIYFLPLLVDSMTAEVKDIRTILLYGGAMVFFDILLQVLNSTFSVQLEKYADFFLNDSSVEISRRCMELDFALTENKEALDQIKKAREGLNWSGGVHEIAKAFFSIISNGLRIFGAAAVLAVNAPWLLLLIAVLLTASTLINRKKNDIDIKNFTELSGINRIFGHICWEMEDFRYGKDIRLYGAAGMMIEKASQQINRLNDYWKRINDKKFPLNILDIIVTAARDFGTYLYLGFLAIMGKITIGTFSQLLTAGGSLNTALQGMVFGFQDIVKRSSYAYEIVKFMEYPPLMEKGNRRIENPEGGHTIEFRNVSFTYPGTDVQVLKNTSITLRSGERLSVVGLNGAGKTTFIKLLCRLYDVTEGEILLDGVNIRDYDYEEYMKLFSVVFQDFRLLAFSVRDNVLLGNEEPDETVDGLMEKVGLSEKIRSLPHGRDTMMFKQFDKEGVELSGGEQQKLAIARALYKDAPVVILDEPTAALDPVAEYEIYKRFDELVGGKTAVYISHRLSSCKFCDKIAVFSEGTVKEYGTHDQLLRLKDGIYAEMFKAQAQYYI